MASTSVWSASSLELSGDCLEPGGNNKNSDKNFMISISLEGDAVTYISQVIRSREKITCLLHYNIIKYIYI